MTCRPYSRTPTTGENNFFSSVARLGAELDLPVYAPEDVNHPLWVDRIRDLQPDVIFSFYYRHMLSDEILAGTAGRLQPARFAAAALPWPRPGELGAGERRNRNRRHAAQDGETPGRRRHRRSAESDNRRQRHRADAAQKCWKPRRPY